MKQMKLNGSVMVPHTEFYRMIEEDPDILRPIYIPLVKAFLKRTICDALMIDKDSRKQMCDNLENAFDFGKFLDALKFKTDRRYESHDGWDLVFTILNGRIHFYVEYKSSAFEWGKELPNFLAQINKRSTWGSDSFKVLATFDIEFLKYESVLKTNGIQLIILNWGDNDGKSKSKT